MKFHKILLLILFILLNLNAHSRDYIIVQSTTSIANTGLLDLLSSKFEKQTGIKVRPIAVGTGNAISNAKRGDGDVLMVCLLYTSPSPRDKRQSRMPSSA